MFTFIKHQNGKFLFSTISRVMVMALSLSLIFAPSAVHAQSINLLNLPAPGTMVLTSPAFNPAIVTGIKIYPDNPLQFDFIIDIGDDQLQGKALKKESQKLINYFMATLTVPEDEMWVNLSPYEKDRIIAEGLSHTEMGRDMLAQDYLLKQLTASLMYPEDDFGKDFWNRVYSKAKAQYGTTEIPMNTFNKIWIVPNEAVVYAHETNVFVVENHLKVMLEEDYLALESNVRSTKHGLGNITKDDIEVVSGVSAEIIRKVLLPEIENEINEGKNFANLRQMYNSMLLATWYKKNLKESLLGQVYVDKNKVNGIELDDKEIKQRIYDQYVEAFKKGVYNYIKEDIDSATQEVIPRKYFSGGVDDYINNGEERFSVIGGGIPGSFVNQVRSRQFVSVGVGGETLGNDKRVSSPISDNLREVRAEAQTLLDDITGDKQFAGDGKKTLHVVMGNEASDMDSMISSIAYAFAMNTAQGDEQDTLFVPLMNIPQAEFRLRPEAVNWINQLGIVESDLLFTDTFDVQALASTSRDDIRGRGYDARITLMDHNNLASHQKGLWSYVSRIIDHHKDEEEWKQQGALQQADAVKIDTSFGSNTTMVALIAEEVLGEIPVALAQLLLGPIIKDTVNFQDRERYNDTDERVAKKLLTATGIKQDATFDALSKAAFDISNLSSLDLLRSDFKGFEMGSHVVGVASLKGGSMEKLNAKGDLREGIVQFISEFEGTDKPAPTILFGMNIDLEGDGVSRDLFIFSPNSKLLEALIPFLRDDSGRELPLEIEDIDTTNPNMASFKTSVKISRKKLVPYLQEFFTSDAAQSATSSPIMELQDFRKGGIDFNASNVSLKEQGDKIQINFSATNIQNLNPETINGILPVIINISPLPSVLPLLGLEPRKKENYIEVSSLN